MAVQATTVPEIRQRCLTGHFVREFEQWIRNAGILVKLNVATNSLSRRGSVEDDVTDETVYQCKGTMVARTDLKTRG